MNNVITIDEEDVEFIYWQLRLRRGYLTDEMARQSKIGDSNEVLICLSGIKKLDKVMTSILAERENEQL